jgi:hypothetical protein
MPLELEHPSVWDAIAVVNVDGPVHYLDFGGEVDGGKVLADPERRQ